jgi:Flp pilus assembly pilin Flp
VQFLNELIARLTSWTEREEGQTLVEYALIIALVSIALVASLQLLAGGIQGVFTDIIAQF